MLMAPAAVNLHFPRLTCHRKPVPGRSGDLAAVFLFLFIGIVGQLFHLNPFVRLEGIAVFAFHHVGTAAQADARIAERCVLYKHMLSLG